MKHLIRFTFFTLTAFGILIWPSVTRAADFDEVATGNYGATNVWGGLTSPSNAVADTVTINSHTVTINTAYQATNDWISIYNGGTLSVSTGFGLSGVNVTNWSGVLSTTGVASSFDGGTITLAGGSLLLGNINQDVLLGGYVRVISNSVIADIGGNNNPDLSFQTLELTGGVSLVVTSTQNVAINHSIGAPTLSVTGSGGTLVVSNQNGFMVFGSLTGDGALTKAGNRELRLTNAASAFTGSLRVNDGTLTLSGANAINGATVVLVNGGTVDATTGNGANGSSLVVTGGTLRAGAFNALGSSPVALKTGTLLVANSGIGSGLITISGGNLLTDNTARTISNSLVIAGNFTFSALSGANNLTIDPTPLSGFITNSGANTITLLGNTLTVTGIVVGANTPSLAVRGALGTLALLNSSATASTFGNLTVGDGTTFSGNLVGGNVTLSSTNAFGGSVTVNYGGVVTLPNTFNPTNSVTVRGGGAFYYRGAAAPSNPLVLDSLATLGNANGALTLSTNNITLPEGGVLFFNTGGQNITITGGYRRVSSTMVFGTTAGAAVTFTGTNTLSTVDGTARTLALNNSGGGSLSLAGVLLNADLTVAGSGNTGLTGLYPTGASSLGNVVQDATSRSLTINMAPAAAVQVTATATGWTGGTIINSGILIINGGNTASKKAGSAGITLNGGGLRSTDSANNTATWLDAITIGARGGVLEAFATGSDPTTIFTNLTAAVGGAGRLTLRYGGTTALTSGRLQLSGDNSSLSGGFTLATVNARGQVQFNGTNATGAAGNIITVPDGVAFGFNDISTWTATSNKFALSSGSILDVFNMTGANIDFTALGKDIRIGSYASVTYTGTYTPYGNTYNFTPTTGATLTLTNLNQLTGSRSLDVSAGAVAPGAIAVATGTLVLSNNTQNYTGDTTVRGTVLNSLMGGGVQGTTLTLGNGGILSGTTNIVVTRSASFNVAGTTNNPGRVTTSAPRLTVMGGGTVTVGDTTAANNSNVVNRLATGTQLILGGSDGGGTFRLALAPVGGTHSQTLASVTVNAGASSITTVNSLAGINDLAITGTAGGAGYVRAVGGLVNFTSNSVNNTTRFINAPTAAGGSSVAGAGGNEILVGAVLNNADFVKAATGDVAVATYVTQNAVGSWAAGQNIKNSAAWSGTLNTISINSLKFESANASTVTINAGQTLTLASGMLLSVPGVNNGISGGNLTSGQSDLIVGVTQSTLTIASTITGGKSVTKYGGGVLSFTSSANSIGDIYAQGGTLRFATSTSSMGSDIARTMYFQGGTVQMALTGTWTYNNTAINVGPQGGTLESAYTQADITLGGAITLNGMLTLQHKGNGADQLAWLRLPGNISGDGVLYPNGEINQHRIGITILSGNNTFTGGLRMNGSVVQLNSPTAAGASTAPIVAIGKSELLLTSNFGSVLTNAIRVDSGLALMNWKTASPVTVLGNIVGAGGLNFQGYATSDTDISETVLAGSLSLAGTPSYYSYGTASVAQNFVNAQSGLTLGGTMYQGVTALNRASNDAILDPNGNGTTNGALGFVRFEGTQSFIPGAVGPGYLAAIRQAGSGGANWFGYLLTGTNTASGASATTYQLPEGKSFVIGSLGAGAQVGGVLGAAGGGTATLLGAGTNLFGFPAGNVNIHANAATDAQTLSLLVRSTSDTLVLGDASTSVVMTPTWGDSGASSAITMMRDRTGATTLTKLGAGTLVISNTAYRSLTGSDVRGSFTWQVNAGTLSYQQVDTGANFAGFTVTNATLAGTGKINGAVTIQSNGTLSPGNSVGTFHVAQSLTLAGTAVMELNATGAGLNTSDEVVDITALFYGGNLKVTLASGAFAAGQSWDLFDFTSQSGTFLNNATFGTAGDGVLLPTLSAGNTWAFDYGTGTLSIIPEPSALSLVGAGLALLVLTARRRR